MKKVGQVLQDARKKHAISIKKIARKTHIRTVFLKAIEDNDFSALPNSTVAKGFIKSYAQQVGVDEKTVLALFRRDFKQDKQGNIVDAKSSYSKRKAQRFILSIRSFFLAVIVLSIVIAYSVVQWWSMSRPPYVKIIRPVENEFVGKTVHIEGETQEDISIFINSKPVVVNPDGMFTTTIRFQDLGTHAITIRAVDRREKSVVIQRNVRVVED